MPREANVDWDLSRQGDGSYSYAAAQLAVLMDIRDELRTLNGVLLCTNFQSIPTTLRRIQANTTKTRRHANGT